MPGFTNPARNALIDFYMRGQTLTPPANLYLALCTSAPSASAAGTEVSTSGTGYGRQTIPASLSAWAGTQADLSTAASSGTSGVTSNNSAINFGTATGSWGAVSHWELWDAATGGNRVAYGTIVNGSGVPTPRSIGSGDPVSFPASTLRITWA